MRLNDRLRHRTSRLIGQGFSNQNDRVLSAVGELQCKVSSLLPPKGLNDAEFSIFSQWGEDGIIQHLLATVEILEPVFVEIGVGDYSECNTRFLATQSNWSGLAVDMRSDHVDLISRKELDWRYGIEAVVETVTAGNINQLLRDRGVSRDLGLLSIDVDGQDYWIFSAIEEVDPRIVVIEYNAVFGDEHAVTVPRAVDAALAYRDPTGIWFGASLPALVTRATEKGYVFVGCESHGANAFFVRRDLAEGLPTPSLTDGFRPSRFRTSRSESGSLDLEPSRTAKLRRVERLPLVELPGHRQTTVGEVFGL